MMNRKYVLQKIVALLLLTMAISSCTKYIDPPLVFEKEPEKVNEKKRKVLIIGVDGLAGEALKAYVPQTIAKILPHAKYTFEGVADEDTGDVSTWTSIVSGVSSVKHGIHGNDFEEDFDENDPHGDSDVGGVGFVSIFQRLEETGKKYQSFAVTSNPLISENLFGFAKDNVLTNSDLEVKNTAVAKLKEGSDDLAYSVVHFAELNDAGVEFGFDGTNADYKAAMDKVDSYIGEILTAIEGRETYDNEQWLIVITSNHGGIGNSYGGDSVEERTVPIIYFYKDFTPLDMIRPEVNNSLIITGNSAANSPQISNANASAYTLGEDGEFTVSARVLLETIPGSASHALLFGNTNAGYGSVSGWHFMIEGSNTARFRVILGDGTSNLKFIYGGGKSAVTGLWYTLMLRVYKEGNIRYAQLYINGEAGTAVDITGFKIAFKTNSTATRFTLGPGGLATAGTANFKINNLAFINKALTEQEIADLTCQEGFETTSAYYGDITGFWKLAEGSGKEALVNQITTTNNTNFQITQTGYRWKLGANWGCQNANKPILYAYDIFASTFYWIKETIPAAWGIEGTSFLSTYETEFVGK